MPPISKLALLISICALNGIERSVMLLLVVNVSVAAGVALGDGLVTLIHVLRTLHVGVVELALDLASLGLILLA